MFLNLEFSSGFVEMFKRIFVCPAMHMEIHNGQHGGDTTFGLFSVAFFSPVQFIEMYFHCIQ